MEAPLRCPSVRRRSLTTVVIAVITKVAYQQERIKKASLVFIECPNYIQLLNVTIANGMEIKSQGLGFEIYTLAYQC